MFSKRLLILRSIRIICLGLMLGVWAMHPLRAQAQCGDYPPDSSCTACHEESYPVSGKGEWHAIHAEKDCCWNCHGGNTKVQDKDLAHEGMIVQPLGNTYQNCYACHPSDYQARADRFGLILGIVPDSQTPTPQPAGSVESVEDLQLMILPASNTMHTWVNPGLSELVCLGLGLGVSLAILLWKKIHHRSPFLTS